MATPPTAYFVVKFRWAHYLTQCSPKPFVSLMRPPHLFVTVYYYTTFLKPCQVPILKNFEKQPDEEHSNPGIDNG